MGTLLFDLLNDPEAADRRNVFDIPLLASRLVHAQASLTAWYCQKQPHESCDMTISMYH